jgi:NADH dehydrogenase
VIVGAGFAAYRTARTSARPPRHKVGITLLDPTGYFPYLPLLFQVAVGVLEPLRVTVSLSGTLTYDRFVLAVGGVNKLLPVPGVAEYAHGFRGLPEALYLRDHVTRQVEPAATSDDTCAGTQAAAAGGRTGPSRGVRVRGRRRAARQPRPRRGRPAAGHRIAGTGSRRRFPGVFASRPEGET